MNARKIKYSVNKYKIEKENVKKTKGNIYYYCTNFPLNDINIYMNLFRLDYYILRLTTALNRQQSQSLTLSLLILNNS